MKTEKEVEFYWRDIFNNLGFELSSPYGCDMYAEKDNLSVLGEFKHNYDLNSIINFSKAMTQLTRYLYKFKHGQEKTVYPSVIFVGTEKEAIFVYTTELEDIINDNKYNWNKAPSSFSPNDKLLREIIKRDFIKIRIPIDENTKTEIRKLINNLKRSSKIFVNVDNFVKIAEWISANLGVSYRIALELLVYQVIDPSMLKINEKKKQVRIGRKRVRNLDFDKYNRLMSMIDLSELSKQEEELRRKFDKLRGIEERVKYGVYYTPLDIVNLSHKYLEDVLGTDFYDKYVVWDPAAGTGNLTIGKQFRYLFSTTIDQVEHDIKMELGVNPEAVHEIHDFLADPSDYTLKQKYPVLNDALSKGNILFYLNPPYKGNSTMKMLNRVNTRQTSLIKTCAKSRGYSLINTSYEFLFKIISMAELSSAKNFYVGIFLPIGVFNGITSIPIRKLFLSQFEFKKGFLFSSKRFDGINNAWPVSFTIWKKRKKRIEVEKKVVEIDLDLVDDDFGWFDSKFKLKIILDKNKYFIGYCNKCPKKTLKNTVIVLRNALCSISSRYYINNTDAGATSFLYDSICDHKLYETSFVSVASSVPVRYTQKLFPICQSYIQRIERDRIKEANRIFINNLVYLALSTDFIVMPSRSMKVDFNDPPNNWGFRDYIQRNHNGTYKLYNHFFPFEEWFIKRLYKRFNAEHLWKDYKSYRNKRLVQEVVETKKNHLFPEVKDLLKFAKKCFILIAKLNFPDITIGDVSFRHILAILRELGYTEIRDKYMELSNKAYRRLIKEMHDIGMI